MRDRDVRELNALIDRELELVGELPMRENQFGALVAESRWYEFENVLLQLHSPALLDREYCGECENRYPCDTLRALADYCEWDEDYL